MRRGGAKSKLGHERRHDLSSGERRDAAEAAACGGRKGRQGRETFRKGGVQRTQRREGRRTGAGGSAGDNAFHIT